jgi:hypothetical protein
VDPGQLRGTSDFTSEVIGFRMLSWKAGSANSTKFSHRDLKAGGPGRMIGESAKANIKVRIVEVK